MPYYDSLKVSDEKNMDRIVPGLRKREFIMRALSQVFAEQEEVLYHKRIPIGIIKGRRWQQILCLQLLAENIFHMQKHPVRRGKILQGFG